MMARCADSLSLAKHASLVACAVRLARKSNPFEEKFALNPRAVMTVIACVLCALPRVAPGQDRVPEGMGATDWSSIRAAYEANRHAAMPVAGGYQARNPGQQWRTRFDGRGFETTPDAGGWRWGLELLSYGVAPVSSRCKAAAPLVSHCGQRIEYEWDEVLTEWYVNDARGLEHGYTVHQRPDNQSPDREGGVSSRVRGPSQSQADPSLKVTAPNNQSILQFTLGVRGDLCAQISADGRSVTFVNASSAPVVNYAGLKVTDADDAEAPAWFEAATDGLRICVNDRGARYPLTIDPIAQQAYLKASNPGTDYYFGNAIAISGDTVVVASPFEASSATGVDGNQFDATATDAGAAYVFVRSGNTWSQQAYLKASNTGAYDNFGRSVAISGNTVVVGAYLEDSDATGVDGDEGNDNAINAGASYVFVRSGATWSQQAYLKASNTEAHDFFGHSVAIEGDTLVVGAYREDSNATGVNGDEGSDDSAFDSGAAYVFVRDGTSWSQQAYLKASNTGDDDHFGWSVAISDETIVVGANNEDSNATGVNGSQVDNSAPQSGAAYVFVRSGTTWSQQAYLKASNTGGEDLFADSLAISGDTVVVVAPLEDSSATGVNGNQADNGANNAGAAYVFVRSGTSWSHQAYLKASNTGTVGGGISDGDRFGKSVAALGDTVVVTATREDSSATGVNGNQTDNSATDSGAGYVFKRGGTSWSQQAYLKASNTGANDFFGSSVAISCDSLLLGATGEDSSATGVDGDQADNSTRQSGAVYVFIGVGCSTIADMNCDCFINGLDVGPFVLALLNPPGYVATYPCCNILNGDTQPDGNVDVNDIQGFAALLIS